MTIANITFTRQQALIVQDSLVTLPEGARMCSKTIAFPHARTVLAITGSAGIGVDVATAILSGSVPGDDVRLIAASASEYVTRRWPATSIPTTLFFVGVTADGAIAAFRLRSKDGYAADPLAPGTYLGPPLGVAEAGELPVGPVVADTDPAPLTPALPPSWADCSRAVVRAVRQQFREQSVPCGGRIQTTHVTADGIRQVWLGELGEAP